MSYLNYFFEDIYQSRERSRDLEEIKHLLGRNFLILSVEENSAMEGVITLEEASGAVTKLYNDKSPGPDGFTSFF